ncbi:MAG: DUF4784 domain-containing protein, partial [Alistipes onderdonkii]|nr:DUF4784 domain-containing protein [Alistipes onderdonkii]
MKKLLFLSFFGLFLLACTTDEGDGAPFVTDVVMPPSSQLFAPGDEVTVAARGFEADDDIMLRIAWPLSQAALPEGYADGVWAVVTERTESDITFLAPGGYPASTTEVKLFRRGKAMTLGKISVSDGRPPEEPSLYGVAQCLTGETAVDRIDMATGGLTRIETLGVPEGMRCVVNTPGSNRIYGLAPGGNIGAAAFYDLTMRYFRDSGYDNVAVAGTLGNSAAFLRCEDGRLVLMELNMTRTNVAPVPPSWMLPSDIAPEMLGENPFVTVYGGYLLLAARTAPDTCTPLVLTGLIDGGGYAVKTGDAEQADAMVPFGVLDKGQDGETYYDGGLADPIPILRSLHDGNERNLIVLTQPESYRKTLGRCVQFTAKWLKRKYPAMPKVLLERAKHYNETVCFCHRLAENKPQDTVLLQP